MFRRFGFSCAASVAALTLTALADQNPTYFGPLSASEKQFVQAIQPDLMKRFPTAAGAEKAGYVRYTNADNTGAISYANLQWQTPDIRHPSQLWYERTASCSARIFQRLKRPMFAPRSSA